MPPGVILLILGPLLLIVGGVLFFPSAWNGAAPPRPDSTACIFLLIAGACGLAWLVLVHRHCRKLKNAVGQMVRQGKLQTLDSPDPILRPLTGIVNELIGLAGHSVTEADRRVKDLAVQLKVVMNERQDAQAILYSISDAVLVTNPFDELVLANESAAKLFHFDCESIRRTALEQAVKDPKIVDLIREMRQSHSKAGRRIVEHRMSAPDNDKTDERTFKVTLSCVNDQASEGAGVVAVLHDVTREKEVGALKNEFVSSVSHELRTPLAGIKAYVEMMIDGEAADEKTKNEFYEVIQSEANRLSRLIDNILNISRIESGLVQISRQPQSLTVILKEAIEVIAPQARARQITIVEKLTPIFYQTIADKDMLYQAVLNLLGNAVKYTPPGGAVTIETIVDEDKRSVITHIADTGTGIPPKDLPYVFDKFYRSDANSHMAKGTGLGLSLVKHIVETVHKGRLFVRSEVGKGSCFGFELSLAD